MLPHLIAFCLVIGATLSAGFEAQAADDLIGAVWEVHMQVPGTGKFRKRCLVRCTTDGKVFLNAKEVGTHTNTSSETVDVNITNAPRFNGVIKARKVARNGKLWTGQYTFANGTKKAIRLILLKD